MRPLHFVLASALPVFAASMITPDSAMAEMNIEEQIEARQGTFQFAGWNFGKIKAMAVEETQEYDAEKVQAAANGIAAVANSGLSQLFGPGTSLEDNDNTRLKPNFFDEQEKAREVAMGFIQEADKLQEVARSGDKGAVAEQFKALGDACGACHDNFREED